MPTPAPCRLCLRTRKLNDEDVLATWARKFTLRMFREDGQANPPRIKLRICTECNARMGRRYEDVAAPLIKPLMLGQEVSLTVQEQADISRWVIKTTLLLNVKERIRSGRDYETIRQLLAAMIEVDVPPPGCSVRIGRFPAEEDDPPDVAANLAEILPGGPPSTILFCAVASFGQLGIDVVMTNPADLVDFIARTETSDRLVRIWPPTVQGAEFPPMHLLTRADATALREAFRDRMPHGVFVRHVAARQEQ